VVFRKTIERERMPVPWWRLVRELRTLEARGEVRGGRFVAGFACVLESGIFAYSDMAVRTGFDVIPTGAALGAEVRGIDLRAIDAAAFAAIHRAWLDHQVLLVRDQRLSDQDLIAFSRRVGDLDQAPIQENGRRFVDGYPEIYVVSNVIEKGVAIGSLGSGEAVWHTDMSYLPDPPKGRHELLHDVWRVGVAA
jgi:hypothetical protein